jgi:hypothetical protein
MLYPFLLQVRQGLLASRLHTDRSRPRHRNQMHQCPNQVRLTHSLLLPQLLLVQTSLLSRPPIPLLPAGPIPASAFAQKPAKSKKPVKIIAIVLAILVLLLAVIFGYTKVFGGIKLTTYEGEGFNLQVPKDYERVEDDSGTKFQEKDGEEETRSFVLALAQQYPTTPSEEQKQQLLDLFEKQLPELIRQAGESGEKVDNVSSQKIIHREKDAIRVTADLSKDGKKAKLEMIIVVGDKAVYVAGVAAHLEDTDLAKAANKIVSSLTLTE